MITTNKTNNDNPKAMSIMIVQRRPTVDDAGEGGYVFFQEVCVPEHIMISVPQINMTIGPGVSVVSVLFCANRGCIFSVEQIATGTWYLNRV